MKKNGRPTQREIELAKARQAGHDADRRTFTRVLVERRAASFAALLDAFRAGERSRVIA